MTRKSAVACLLAGLAACAMEERDDDTAAVSASSPAIASKLIQRANAVPDRYIVVMRTPGLGVGLAAIDHSVDRLTTTYRMSVDQRFRTALHGFVAELSPADARAVADDPDVAFVEQDAVVHTMATTQVNVPSWGIDRVDQQALPLDANYKYLGTGAGVTAYVIDTGLRASHAEFTGRALAGFTAINDGQGTNDCNFHGTHVAGTLLGTTFGIAKQAVVVPVRVLDCDGGGTASGIIRGIEWITANRRLPAVANMSLGGGPSPAQELAVTNLVAAGVTVVVAAGNSNGDACLESPARVPQVLTVAASDKADAKAVFSNFGPCVDLWAPGVDIVSASNESDQATVIVSGTSQATPHVAGAAALYLAIHPEATPAQVAAALTMRANHGRILNPRNAPNLLVNTLFIDTTPPTVAIRSPGNGAILPASFSVAIEVDDANLEAVELKVDGELVQTLPASVAMDFRLADLAFGDHALTVQAIDAAGQLASASVQITVSRTAGAPSSPGSSGGADAGGCSTAAGAGLWSGALALALVGFRRRRRLGLS